MDRDSAAFISLLTSHQGQLFGYVVSLTADHTAAQDILQEANVTIWKKAAAFEEGTSFFAWAARIAYFHVMSHRRKQSRDRLVFDDDVLDYLAERQAERGEHGAPREKALRECVAALPDEQRQLIEARYAPGGSVQSIAATQHKSVGAISQALYRIRETLAACVEGKLQATSL